MVAPTAADVQSWTELPELKTATTVRADRLVAIAISTFKRITGQTFEGISESDRPLVEHAITGLSEMLTYQTSPEYIETLSDFDLIASFNAGPYSETRRSADDARKARLLVAWPWLSDLLWGILTPDKYDEWVAFFGGQNAPAFGVQEVDWSAGSNLFGSYDNRSDYYGY